MNDEIRAHRRFIQSQCPVLFDVGANVGEWSNAVAKRLDGNVQLWMFEPQQACREHLQPLVDRGVGILTQAAVGDRDGYANLFTPGGPAGNASLYPRRDTFFSDTQFVPQQVKVITVDGFIEEKGVERVDFMKMDIEGHELAALSGATKALQSKTINALSFEFGSGNVNSRYLFP